MVHQKVELTDKQADGYVIPLGPVNLVTVVTDKGMLACGAFDVAALDKFNYPAARVKSAGEGLINSIEDLLAGVVREANSTAAKLGVQAGMDAREALEKM